MIPIQPNSSQFSPDQTVQFRATYWDTTMTVPEKGVRFAAFDVLDPSYSPDSIKTTLANPAKFRPVLGSDGTSYRTGLVPNVYAYWGAGAPAGVQTARRVALHYSGTITGMGALSKPVTLVLGGMGRVEVWNNGGKVLDERVGEPSLFPTWGNELEIEASSGLQILELALKDGDLLDICYLQNGEPWGGVFAKVIPQAGLKNNWTALREALFYAPVVSASLLSAGLVPPVSVPYLVQGEVRQTAGQISGLTLEVVTVPEDTSHGEPGFVVDSSTGETHLVDNLSGLVIKPQRLLSFEAGYRRPGVAGEAGDEFYPRFTGLVDEITPAPDGKSASITCRGFEAKLEVAFDENYPDVLAYHAHGFVDREWLGYPVWDTPAFDSWPLELALAECCIRAGIDSHSLGRSPRESDPVHGKRRFTLHGAPEGTVVHTGRLFSARSLTQLEPIFLQRQPNYGNHGLLRREFLPPDDAYLYGIELTERLYDRVIALAHQYGYDFFFNAEGQAVLGARNNPVSFTSCMPPAVPLPTEGRVSPASVGGTYLRRTHSDDAWSFTHQGQFSRLDLYTGGGYEENPDGTPGLNGGRLEVKVRRREGGDWVAVPELTRVVSTYLAAPEGFLYDDRVRSDGTNACLHTILQAPFAEYEVSITPYGPDLYDTGATDCVYRLNGIATFDRDPMASALPELSTVGNVLDLKPESNEKDRRNHVIVVGARQATVTDSSKFLLDKNDQNPNNPLPEHFVSVSADPYSIYDPTATNFTGGKKVAVVVDDKVTDGEFARWLSRLILYRYRAPKLSATLEHTALPVLELRDPVRVKDARDGSLPHLLWVTELVEKWDLSEATSQLTLSSYPELPSYTPREDVDLALFGGRPVYRPRVRYQNLYGETVTHTDLSPTLTVPQATYRQDPLTLDGSQVFRTAPGLVEGTLSLVDPDPIRPDLHTRALVNNPYRHFWHVRRYLSDGSADLTLDVQEGDGTAGIYDMGHYGLPGGWQVRYAQLGARTGKNPFYDPYTSEVGNLIQVSFDALVSGLYRISVWAVSESGEYDTPVAWLTHPGADSEDREAHWAHYDAGVGKTLYYDAVDSIGEHNRRQSTEYGRIHEGDFLDKPMIVGKGNYAWNDQRTPLLTQIGDVREENFHYDDAGRLIGLYFTVGRYTRLYLKFEVKSDTVLRRSGASAPLEVNTQPESATNPNGLPLSVGQPGDTAAFYLYTHLGEPSGVHIRAEEWNPTGGPWSPYTLGDSWEPIDLGNSEHASAQIRLDKPVRFTFTPVPRRGYLFRREGDSLKRLDPEKGSVQLSRFAHLKATFFDQFWTFLGEPWKDAKRKGVEEKRLTSRMYHNEEHTVEFSDSTWSTGREIAAFTWVFEPSQFKTDFGGGLEEVLRYGDYTQLENIPGRDPRRGGGTSRRDRSHLTYAYVNYLFYFSAFVTDRSGRRQWAIDPRFVDKSKIVTPTWRNLSYTPEWENPVAGMRQYALRYPRLGAEEYLVRSIFVRQWVEPGWASGGYPGNPVTAYGITDAHQRKFVQVPVHRFGVYDAYLRDSSDRVATHNYWLQAYGDRASHVNNDITGRSSKGVDGHIGVQASMPAWSSIPNATKFNLCPSGFGSWNFVRGNYPLLYKPCPGMDFQPFWTKAMPDFNERETWNWGLLDVLGATGSQRFKPFRDVTAQDTWHGWSESDAYMMRSGTAKWMEDAGARLEDTGQNRLSKKDHGLEDEQSFDYVKQDTLDRYEHYRGVISRGELKDRDEADACYWDGDKDRIAPAQPVRPSGVYLLNLGRYDDFIVGGMHKDRKDIVIHTTERVQDFFDIRFRHQYVWYGDRHFPIFENGGTAYYRVRQEYTGVNVPTDTHPMLRTTGTFYDAGAWVGWKDDHPTADWSASPYLRWAEWASPGMMPISLPIVGRFGLVRDGETNSTLRTAPSGGYASFRDDVSPGGAGPVIYKRRFQGKPNRYFQRQNLFSGPHGEKYGNYMRLAVGPELPESVRLVMNLTLPSELI